MSSEACGPDATCVNRPDGRGYTCRCHLGRSGMRCEEGEYSLQWPGTLYKVHWGHHSPVRSKISLKQEDVNTNWLHYCLTSVPYLGFPERTSVFSLMGRAGPEPLVGDWAREDSCPGLCYCHCSWLSSRCYRCDSDYPIYVWRWLLPGTTGSHQYPP